MKTRKGDDGEHMRLRGTEAEGSLPACLWLPASPGPAVAVAMTTALILGGCGEQAASGDRGWEGQVRDSAGITVVENVAATSVGQGPFRVREVAVVGGADDKDGPDLGYVVDVTLDGDTLYVLDAFAQTVSVWGPSGRHLRNVGGPGEGPGELSRFTSSVLLEDDTILVADWGRGRVHRFLRDGTFLDAPLTSSFEGRSWWRRAGDGRLYARILIRYVDDHSSWRGDDLLVRPMFGDRREGMGDGPGTVVATDTVFRFDYAETDVGGPGRPVLPLVVNAPTWEVLPDGRLAWTTLALDELRIHGVDGRLQRIVRSRTWMPRPPTGSDESALNELMGDKLVSLGGSREAVDQIGGVLPRLLPTLTSVRSGPDSTIWMQRMGRGEDVHAQALNTPDPPTGWGGRRAGFVSAGRQRRGGHR